MKTKRDIDILLENGIHFNTISKMNKNQIALLANKFVMKEQAQVPQNTTPQTITTTKYLVKPGSKTMINGVEIDTTGGKTTATPMKETELSERFASKAQQKLFFAKCGAGKTKEEKKWCKMRDEFAKSTKKMDYKNMPEKIHPEKTVKYKKNRTDEAYQKYLEDKIFEMIEKHIEPTMSKKEIIQTVMEKVDNLESMILKNPKKMSMFSKESGIEQKGMKTPIGKLYSMGKSLEEDTKEKERTKTKPGTKERKRQNPFKDPNPGVKEKPKAGVEKQKSDFMMAIKQAVKM